MGGWAGVEPNIYAPPGTYERTKICEDILETRMKWLSCHAQKFDLDDTCMYFSVPKCSEPFQTLGMMYEEQGDQDKALQVQCFLNAIHCQLG